MILSFQTGTVLMCLFIHSFLQQIFIEDLPCTEYLQTCVPIQLHESGRNITTFDEAQGQSFLSNLEPLPIVCSYGTPYHFFITCIAFCFVFFSFLWLHLRHMEVPEPGVESELQLWPTPQSWQHRIQATSVTSATTCGSTRSLTWE